MATTTTNNNSSNAAAGQSLSPGAGPSIQQQSHAALDGSLLTKYNLMQHHSGRPVPTPFQHHPFVHPSGAGGFMQPTHLPAVSIPGLGRADPWFVAHPGLNMNPPRTAAQPVFSPASPGVATPSADGTTTSEVTNYKDYSRLPLDATTEEQRNFNSTTATSSGKDPSFPVKLHRILSVADHEEFITWLPHGRSWRVLKPKAFEAKVIPLYFRHAKYASFMRQVNGWGFKRITQGPDHNSYYHELFLRGLPHLCTKMQRPPKTKNGAAPPQDTNMVHPDFYHLSIVAPLPPAGGVPVARPQPQTQYSQQPTYVSASPAISGEGSGDAKGSNCSDLGGGASDDSGSGKDCSKSRDKGHKIASDSSSTGSKASDTERDGAVKNFSSGSSSSAYAGGSEGGSGDSGSGSGSDSDPLSDEKEPEEKRSISQSSPRNKPAEASTNNVPQQVSQKPSREEEPPKPTRSTPVVRPQPMGYPTMLPNGAAAARPAVPMMQYPGSNVPYIIVQQPGGGQPMVVQQQQQQPPPQPQFLRVVNQSGGEVGYIQLPAGQGMPGQMVQQNPSFVQGMPPGATFVPAGNPAMQQATMMQPTMMQPQFAMPMQQMAMQQQMQQQMQMVHAGQQMVQMPQFQPMQFPAPPPAARK